tara:strand:- start:416 stop:1132 length:717 start_codon:yes stop_codon:yes gene_type:complete
MMIKIIIPFIFCLSLYAHDIKDDFISWKYYSRITTIQSINNNYGFGTYLRIKRNTKYSFKDLRLFAHQVFKDGSFYKLRYKNSSKFINLNRFYNFSVLSFDKNDKIGLNIRSQGSQGIGLFLIEYEYGHYNTEISFSYDMMDHLNDTKKTSYLKFGNFWDNNIFLIESKLELEAIYQISDIVDEDLSRIELLIEVYYPIMKNINFILGFEIEDYIFQSKSGYSYFLSIGYKKSLKWNF